MKIKMLKLSNHSQKVITKQLIQEKIPNFISIEFIFNSNKFYQLSSFGFKKITPLQFSMKMKVIKKVNNNKKKKKVMKKMK